MKKVQYYITAACVRIPPITGSDITSWTYYQFIVEQNQSGSWAFSRAAGDKRSFRNNERSEWLRGNRQVLVVEFAIANVAVGS